MSETVTFPAKTSNRHLAASIGKNTIFGIISAAMQIGTRLITVPFVIHKLGLDGYGIWSVIMVTAAYMRFGCAGIRSAFQKYVAEATGTGEFETANKLLTTGSISMLVLSLAGLLPLSIFSKKLAMAAGVPPVFLASAAVSIVILASIYVVANYAAVFEAVVLGGHRIDLTRKVNGTLSICEAIAILTLLHFGFGLIAMTLVMGASELVYAYCCYRASHRIVPQVDLSLKNFTPKVFPELIRFGGTYQLVNFLEILYTAVVPVVLLRAFGADAAGVYAVANRVVTSALVAQEALVLPILSGGSLIFASGSKERIQLFISKAIKVSLTASVPPLMCVCLFGSTLILAWTGQANPLFNVAVWLYAASAFLKGIAMLQLILYRASGKAFLDNIRQLFRTVAIFTIGVFSAHIGFAGVLASMASVELIGVVFMFFAVANTKLAFNLRQMIIDAFKILTASAIMGGTGLLATMVPIHWGIGDRVTATIRVAEFGAGCLLAAWPALAITKSLDANERRTFLDSIIPGRKIALP